MQTPATRDRDKIEAPMIANDAQPDRPPRLVAGILVGGRSRRMGRDKALIDVGGETLLERTLRVAKQCADTCVLVGDAPFEIPASLRDLRRVPDASRGAGPIAGLLGLMEAFPSSAVLLLACDMPQLGEELVRQLAEGTAHSVVAPNDTGWQAPGGSRDGGDERLAAGACEEASGTPDDPGDAPEAVVPETVDRGRAIRHPCCAIYRPAARRAVEMAIEAGRFEMNGLLDMLRIRPVRVSGEMARQLLNWNTPIDLLGGRQMGRR